MSSTIQSFRFDEVRANSPIAGIADSINAEMAVYRIPYDGDTVPLFHHEVDFPLNVVR